MFFLRLFLFPGSRTPFRGKIASLYTTAKIVVVFLVKTWSNINFWSAKNVGPAPDKQSLTPSGSDFKTDQNTFVRGELLPSGYNIGRYLVFLQNYNDTF